MFDGVASADRRRVRVEAGKAADAGCTVFKALICPTVVAAPSPCPSRARFLVVFSHFASEEVWCQGIEVPETHPRA